jgi:hypothetical protein
MRSAQDNEAIQIFNEWMDSTELNDAHVIKWLNTNSVQVTQYLKRQAEHAKRDRTPEQMAFENAFGVWEKVDTLMMDREAVETGWAVNSKQTRDEKNAELGSIDSEIAELISALTPNESAPAQTALKVTDQTEDGETASDGSAPLNKIVHSTRTRRDTLTPVIEKAQSVCNDPKDTAAVWAALQVLAENKTAPLFGATEDGLQYFKNGRAAYFNREALRKRLGR